MTLGTQSSAIADRAAVYCSPQASTTAITYPVAGPPTTSAGGYVRTLSSDIGMVQQTAVHGFTKRAPREFAGAAGSTYPQIRTQEWSLEARLAPPAALAGVPELHHLLTAVWGQTSAPTGQRRYELATLNRHPLLSLARLANVDDRVVGEWLEGCVVSEMSLAWQGGTPPALTFSGRARRHIAAGATTLAAGVTSATAITIPADAAHSIEVGARISVGAATNVLVTAVNAAGTTLTVTPAVTAILGAEIRPWMPAPAPVLAQAFGAIEGSVSLGGVALPCTAMQWSINHSSTIVEDEIGAVSMTDAVPGETVMEGALTVRATEQEIRRLVARKRFTPVALTWVAGAGVGRTATLSMPAIEMWVDKMSLGAGAPGTIEVPFRALDLTEAPAAVTDRAAILTFS